MRINALFGDGSQSWVMICNGLNQYETEMSEETQENRKDNSGASAARPAANARPKQTSLPMSSSPRVTMPFHVRFWIDVEPGECDPRSFEVSKIRTRLLRHKLEVSKKGTKLLRHDRSVLRKEDGGVEFKILAPMFAGWKRCQERETDGILHSRESYVRTSTEAAGLRRGEAQNCSLQTKLENTSEYSVLGQFGSCAEKGIDVLPNKI